MAIMKRLQLKTFLFLAVSIVVVYILVVKTVLHVSIRGHRPTYSEAISTQKTNTSLQWTPENPDSESLYRNGEYWKTIGTLSHVDISGKDKFVIFDSGAHSESLEFLSAVPRGWSIFVVNNKHDAQLTSCPICMSFQNVPKASEILNKIRSMNHGNVKAPDSAIQKMAAVLYAATKDTPYIYTTNKCMPVPFDQLTRAANDQPEKGVVYKGPKDYFQPCRHFMDTFAWNGKAALKDQDSYVLRDIARSSLYQIVDECYRLDIGQDKWQSHFDQQAPVAHVLSGVWAAVDFNNIFVSRKAIWTLLASMPIGPSTDTKFQRYSGLLSMVVQRMLWETQNTIGFLPGIPSPANSKNSCPSCEIERIFTELGQSKMLDSFVKWNCDKVDSVSSCLKNFVGVTGLNVPDNKIDSDGLQKVKNIVDLWVALLGEYKIEQDARIPLNKDILNAKNVGNTLYFTPAKSLHKEDSKGQTLPTNHFRDVCGDKDKPYLPFIPDKHPETFNEVVLVISFNFNEYLDSIRHLDFLYGRHFKHIVYCATGIKAFEDKYMKTYNVNPVTFVDVDIHRGYFGHHCMVAAMEMNYNAKGYLYLSDDVPINVWNMYRHPYNMPWFQTDIRVVNLASTFTRGHDFAVDWYPWNKPTGKPAITKSINTLKSLKQDKTLGPRVTWFLKNLEEMTSCDSCIAYMDADLYYIPQYMASDFRFFVPYFKGVFQELSMPTILSGITPLSDRNVYRLRGYYLVGKFKRDNFDKSWSFEDLFTHPVKLSALSNAKVKKFFCDMNKRSESDLKRFVHS